ncbi:MAG TPA: prolyl oligopeptidase family serine peptidase [Longimicrobiales bacterium]|nr:prolyl oligopeptidase family serine peptidase [Longimicrobiales bacterium]
MRHRRAEPPVAQGLRSLAVLPSLILAAALVVGSAAPLTAQGKPPLTPSDYGKWETLGSYDLDPTGRWLAASIRRTDESVEVRLRRADGSSETLVLPHATGPRFSGDGRWLAYLKGVSPKDAEAAEKAKKPARTKLGLVNLAVPKDSVHFEARSFAFSDDGRWLAAQAFPSADTLGSDLIVLDPATGALTLFGNVDAYAWRDGGALVAMTLRTASGAGNGVSLFDPAAGVVRTLDAKHARYRALTWREGSGQLAVLRSLKDTARVEDSHDALVWDDVTRTEPPRVLAGAGRPGLGDTLRVTEHAGIAFDAAGRTLFVGLRPWEMAPPRPAAKPDSAAASSDPVKPADVQVWHWDDDEIIRAQEFYATRDAQRTFLAAWNVDADRLVVLGDELEEPVQMVSGGAWGLVPDHDPYHVQRRFGDDAADWYRVDPATGARTLLAEGVRSGVQTGPDGRFALVYEDDRWVTLTLATLERRVLGEGTGAAFTRSLADYDYPGPRPPWGLGGWLEGERAVFLHDKHDVWRADPTTGALTRLTRGAEEGREYRVVNPDPETRSGGRRPTALPARGPLWMSMRDLTTKASGYAQVARPGDARPAQARTLLLEDAMVTGLRRARDAERYAVRKERWDDSPDVFVGGSALAPLEQVTATNPFQVDHAWGRSELVSYTTGAGHRLQAILVYPAGFEAGKKYPLILYQYERLSDGLHRYYAPSEMGYYNYQVWSQQGYFVLMPDIVYEPGRPGPSALDAVEHALDAAVATGQVDASRMGLIGHSWGGYQAAYLPTRTHRFAAAVAGAAITDFISFAGNIHWAQGFPEFGHWETGQARMGLPPWESLENHLESSPVNFIAELRTPVLLMHGDADGTVDFRQGQEYYNYARRAGKEVAMLVYPGADHGLRKKEHQVDYHRRILEWFGHFLKGEPAPAWIERGESWQERAKRIGG